jgi:hypothetical protein
LRRNTGPDPLASAIAVLKQDVQQAGLTDEEIEAELEAYNAERCCTG